MLTSLIIDNFQSHEHSEFDFVEGVNVIQGTSNTGKSAVIRALQWVILNQPRGTSFKRHTVEDSGPVQAFVSNDAGAKVTRYRKKTNNAYFLQLANEEIKFEALRTDVPEEIKTALNLDEINIQSQFTPHFLLANTAGEVARTLNTYTGLEIIDKVLKAATGNSMKISNNISSLEAQIEVQNETINSYTTIEDLLKLKQKLNERLHIYEKSLQTYNDVDSILMKIEEIMSFVDNLKKTISLKSNVKKINKLMKSIDASTQKVILLKQLLNSINVITSTVTTIKQELKKKPTIKKIINKLQQIEENNQRYDEITDILKVTDELEFKIKIQNDRLKKYRKELSQIKVCPLCGGVWKGGNHERVRA